MSKLNRTKTIAFTLIGSVSALAALLIFLLLPTSELANGIQYSGTDALWVLAISPVAAVISAASFIIAFIKDGKTWSGLLSKPIVIGAAAILAVLNVFNFVVYVTYFSEMLSLGFVAPYTDTIYEYLAIAATMFVVIKLLYTGLATIAAIRNK